MDIVGEGEACIDCVLMHANGENSADVSWDVEAYRNSGEWALDSSGDEWFSWSPCDVCGSQLGGDRYPIVFFG